VRLEPLFPLPPALLEAAVLQSPPLALADVLPLEVLTTALADQINGIVSVSSLS
jgi:hypothetical protein